MQIHEVVKNQEEVLTGEINTNIQMFTEKSKGLNDIVKTQTLKVQEIESKN